jgi:hypothetical protein
MLPHIRCHARESGHPAQEGTVRPFRHCDPERSEVEAIQNPGTVAWIASAAAPPRNDGKTAS